MSKLDKYYRVIVNQNSNDFNDKPEYVIQTLFSDKTHLTKNQYKTGNGEWREFSKNNTIYSRLEDACGALITKSCKKQAEQIRSLEEQLKNSITPKFKIGQKVYAINHDEIHYLPVKRYEYDVKIYKLDTNEEVYSLAYGFEYEEFGWNFNVWEDGVFATREDAEKRLAELKGE